MSPFLAEFLGTTLRVLSGDVVVANVRLAHALLPIPGKGTSDWGYAWVRSSARSSAASSPGSTSRSGPPDIARMKYILALDQGTTSSRAIIFDHGRAVVAIPSLVERT